MTRVKYPLTEEAKEAARSLVEAWSNQQIGQYFEIADVSAGAGLRERIFDAVLGASDSFEVPAYACLLELAQFKLLAFSLSKAANYGILLMQELCNAVQSDFEVSDFYLTTHAVGTIINAAENASVIIPALQSAASGTGDIQQTQNNTSELVMDLLKLLGDDADPDLLATIRELEHIAEPERKRKYGAVIQQLGNILQHGANTAVVIQALIILGQFMYHNNVF